MKRILALLAGLVLATAIPVFAQVGGSITGTGTAIGNLIGLGTGVATALGVNVGSTGAVVVQNGAGGTPSSITLTNATGYTAYTPTLTGHGGGASLDTSTATGSYLQIGKMIQATVIVTIAGTITATSFDFSLPVAAAQSNATIGVGNDQSTGAHLFVDTALSASTGYPYISSVANTPQTPVATEVSKYTLVYQAP